MATNPLEAGRANHVNHDVPFSYSSPKNCRGKEIFPDPNRPFYALHDGEVRVGTKVFVWDSGSDQAKTRKDGKPIITTVYRRHK